MPQPIPTYLLALAVGDLEFRALGPRTGVWAEPSKVDAAAREFEDAEAMLARTEALWGPYRWGRYDVLMLPPSFPFGGMENPRLTFMTPTVIAGDKSLVGVLAHELAHSWSGNLVTNATWRDGWLNEGFTTYFERRIMEAVYGEERARMEWGVGYQDLRQALDEVTPEEAWQGELAPDLALHPDWDGSNVAYEKGALFLYQLEQIYGRAQLDAFLQGWFARHAFTSVTTPQFVAELQQGLMASAPGRVDPEFLSRWIDGSGLPDDARLVRSDAFEQVDAQRLRWEQGSLATGTLPAERWSVQEWLQFLNGVSRPQSVVRLQELDKRFQLTESQNAEVAHAWFRLAIASGYPGIEPALERYLTSIGRLKPSARCMKTCCRRQKARSSPVASMRRRAPATTQSPRVRWTAYEEWIVNVAAADRAEPAKWSGADCRASRRGGRADPDHQSSGKTQASTGQCTRRRSADSNDGVAEHSPATKRSVRR